MINRKRYSREFKESVVMEMLSGQSSAAQISKREGVSAVTLSKWKDQLASGQCKENNKYELALRKRISELEGNWNKSLLHSHWKIGERIVIVEQNQDLRAEYGAKVLSRLA
jgi:transposase-like protein